jgi:peptidoglycan/LPS O-acetylase OafA/YrhL
MPGVGFRRLFWIGAAALLGVAALISIVALLRGEFTETDWKILGTLGCALLAGSSALAGLALIDRRDLVPLGWAVVAIACVSFAVLSWQIWADFDNENWSLDTLVVVVASLMLATSRLLFRRFEWLYWTSAALTAVTASVYVWAIHADPDGDNWGKALGTLGILAVLAWFLVPVLGRTSGGSSERVVGRGPGRVEVELAEGETLVVRGR